LDLLAAGEAAGHHRREEQRQHSHSQNLKRRHTVAPNISDFFLLLPDVLTGQLEQPVNFGRA
jgi:hypothetical protein